MNLRPSLVMLVACLLYAPAMAQDDAADSDFQKRLAAGREAAYKQFMLRPQVAPVTSRPPPSGASVANRPQAIAAPATRQPILARSPATAYIFRGHSTPVAFGDLRYNFYDNLNNRRSGRWTDYPLFPYIYQPVWDWRYRRSWPRPVVTSQYVASHWLWDGQRYTHVPGHRKYETQWVVQGWPRYRWNGSHYSVSISYRR